MKNILISIAMTSICFAGAVPTYTPGQVSNQGFNPYTPNTSVQSPFQRMQQEHYQQQNKSYEYYTPQGKKLDKNKYDFRQLDNRRSGIDALAVPKPQPGQSNYVPEPRKTGSLLTPDATTTGSLLENKKQWGGKK